MIPKGFTRDHMSDMLNPVFLKTPDGKKWEMCTTKINGDIWFQKGWKEFATYYSLDHGHMVLFQYEENSHFVVHIFSKSTLEIEYPFHGNQHEQNNFDQQSSDEDSIEILDKSPSCKKKTRPKSPIMCPQPHKKLRSDSSEGVGTSSRFQNLPKHHVQSSEDTGASAEFRKVKHELEQEQYQEQEQLNRVRSFKSNNPSFRITMKSSHIYSHSLYVPSQFANNHMKKEQSDILLQLLDGRVWDAKYCSAKINGGWKKFAVHNKLKIGDVCIFELTKSQYLTLKVIIFRLEEDPHSPSPQGNPTCFFFFFL
ncbi:putative transcription factor B3-Domain family [Medicago truncatula]|uniref:Putative transcription factor B3-Domain family n=1 Tax=Medicago truncatula TaxID=3880 RepID=A0A396JLG1_MEDTR|nr:putative transcription factor B3-Domain family [Medicago truncatula]